MPGRVNLLDETCSKQSLDRRVQGGRTNVELTIRAFPDVAQNGIPVSILVGERHEDVERGGG